jgi:CheY-like chemotaxis protein
MDLASNLRPIRGDASTLSNAFMNLCVNSVDAMSEQGTLTLRTRNVDNNWIEAMVEDTGTGMSPDVLKKAMDPFFTTKPLGKGTGLGLSMVYSAVKAHHGQVDIQSEPGRGTRIRLRFPACAPAFRTMAPVPKPPPATSCPAMHTLVVDDDELIQFTLRSMLEILGHKATLAPSGEEALALVEAGLQPDVIILDMNMPGLGGAGTLPRLRALLPNVPILLATGRPDAAVFDLLLAHPYVSLLAKPFTVKVLQSLLLHTQPVIPTNVTPELK